jgi:hypothetical protein
LLKIFARESLLVGLFLFQVN